MGGPAAHGAGGEEVYIPRRPHHQPQRPFVGASFGLQRGGGPAVSQSLSALRPAWSACFLNLLFLRGAGCRVSGDGFSVPQAWRSAQNPRPRLVGVCEWPQPPLLL